jgi:hypothetical protein
VLSARTNHEQKVVYLPLGVSKKNQGTHNNIGFNSLVKVMI